MNMNDIILIKECINEYCEGIYGECLEYMKKNNINPDLSGEDELSKLLRRITNIQDAINHVNDIDFLITFRDECFRVSKVIREMIGG